jgi:hypothetical protein
LRFAQAFTSAAFEENIVGHDNRGAAVLLQDGEDVLDLSCTSRYFPVACLSRLFNHPELTRRRIDRGEQRAGHAHR